MSHFRTNGEWGTVAGFDDDDDEDDGSGSSGAEGCGNVRGVPARCEVSTPVAAATTTGSQSSGYGAAGMAPAAAPIGASATVAPRRQQQQQQFVKLTPDRDTSGKRRPRHAAVAPDAWNVHMFFNLGRAARIVGMVAVCAFFFIALIVALQHDGGIGGGSTGGGTWAELNGDTLATRYSNLVLQPTGDAVFDSDVGGSASTSVRRSVTAVAAALYTNSEQRRRGAGAARTASGYVRYGNFTEVMASSIDFLFPRASKLYVEARAQAARANRTAAVRSLYDAELGESAYVSSYHAHLSAEPNVPKDYFDLASINTISKIYTGPVAAAAAIHAAPNDSTVAPAAPIRAYGKLSLATFDAASQQMFESATFDAAAIHLRAPDVFVAHNALVGGSLYFSMHEFDFEATATTAAAPKKTSQEKRDTGVVDGHRHHHRRPARTAQHSVYMPLVGVSNSAARLHEAATEHADVVPNEARDYGTVAQHANGVRTVGAAGSPPTVEYAVTLGNGDIEHANVLAATSVVVGTLRESRHRRRTNATAAAPARHYALSMVHSEHGVRCARPLFVDEPVRKAYTDATRVTVLDADGGGDATTTTTSWSAAHGAMALRAIAALPVHSYRSLDTGRRHVGVLAQDVQRVMPQAVHDDAAAPTASVRARTDSTSNAADFEVVVGSGASVTVDSDAVMAYVVMAMQEQQRRIERLERALAAANTALGV